MGNALIIGKVTAFQNPPPQLAPCLRPAPPGPCLIPNKAEPISGWPAATASRKPSWEGVGGGVVVQFTTVCWFHLTEMPQTKMSLFVSSGAV